MKIGIITLHRVPNYGSALQAYALQKYIQQYISDDVELIDYKFPNKFHRNKIGVVKKLIGIVRISLEYLIRKRLKREKLFLLFYNQHLKLTSDYYKDIKQIHDDPPIYDLYVTGSDQVWNVETLKNDPVMYCSFAPQNARKIAFGASFTIKSLPQVYCSDVRRWLSEYSYIGVREYSSLEILDSLPLDEGIKRMCTCDPTLLLDAEDYHVLAKQSVLKIDGDYILIYLLNYAFNPEPAISIIAEMAAKHYDCQIIYFGDRHFDYKGKYETINGIGPCEFVYLFENARFILTSSFHGTMFSLINRKSFIAVLPDRNHNDCRIKDVLKLIGLDANGIESHDENPVVTFSNPFTEEIETNLKKYVDESKVFLQQAVSV